MEPFKRKHITQALPPARALSLTLLCTGYTHTTCCTVSDHKLLTKRRAWRVSSPCLPLSC